MAKIDVCDRCGKQSPDKNGKYHKHWVDIRWKRRGSPGSRRYLLCKECDKDFRSVWLAMDLSSGKWELLGGI